MCHCVLNIDQLKAWAQERADFWFQNNEWLNTWFERRYEQWLIDTGTMLQPATEVQLKEFSGSPHIKRATQNGEKIYWFSYAFADHEPWKNDRKAIGVCEWLAELETRDPRLHRALGRISFVQAIEHSGRWHEKLKRDAEKLRESGLPRDDEGAPTVMEITEGEYAGWRWVWLKSNEARDLEGQVMGHCVGGGAYDKLAFNERIVSLRDEKNRPHVTMHLAGRSIRQAATKSNNALGKYAAVSYDSAEIIYTNLMMTLEERMLKILAPMVTR